MEPSDTNSSKDKHPRISDLETLYQCPNCKNFNTVIGEGHEHVFQCGCTDPPTKMEKIGKNPDIH